MSRNLLTLGVLWGHIMATPHLVLWMDILMAAHLGQSGSHSPSMHQIHEPLDQALCHRGAGVILLRIREMDSEEHQVRLEGIKVN